MNLREPFKAAATAKVLRRDAFFIQSALTLGWRTPDFAKQPLVHREANIVIHRNGRKWQTGVRPSLIPEFRPDDKEPADVQGLIDAGITARGELEDKTAVRNLAHAALNQAVLDGHKACVKIHPIMRSKFRNDPPSLDRISKLPVED